MLGQTWSKASRDLYFAFNYKSIQGKVNPGAEAALGSDIAIISLQSLYRPIFFVIIGSFIGFFTWYEAERPKASIASTIS